MRIPLWTTLRPVGNSWPARLTILLPLVGYFIIFNDALAQSQFVNLIREFEGRTPASLGLSIPPRVFQIYFGLCFVAAASALYAWWCPSVVKRHSSAGAYLANEGVHFGEFSVRPLEIAFAQSDVKFDKFRQDVQARISAEYTVQEAFAEVKSAALHGYFDTENSRHGFWRGLIAVLYGIGFAILSIPAAKIFWRVCNVLYRIIVEHGFSALW
jgi:hypothetical protein